MSNDKNKAMSIIVETMENENISLIDLVAFHMEKVMKEEGTNLCDIPSVLHGLSRNVVGALAPE